MKKKKLIIHGGMHKTGSTALQDALLAHRELNQECGVLYPDTGLRHDYGVGSRHFYIRETLFNTHHKENNIWAKLYSESESKNCNVLVLSHENFLSPDKMDLSEINEVNKYFEVSFIVYIRDAISYYNTKYKEWVRRQAFAGESAEFVFEQLKYLDVEKMLTPWIGLCEKGNVFAIPFNRDKLENGSVVDDFSSVLSKKLGVNINLCKVTGEPSNRSYNNHQTLACLIRNQYFGGHAGLTINQRKAFAQYICELEPFLEDGLLLTKGVCVQLKSRSWHSDHFLKMKCNCVIEQPKISELNFCNTYSLPSIRDKLIKEMSMIFNQQPVFL
ncbi:hypothetical protein [Shewanella goraebulensis]|uniref:hypothetical protein n=1 Tax=Shewanella goraebulensis TaxID=3050637 RepID=UPI00254F9637|nr:hypothetical protein [Shewanella goraebulensis]